MIGLIANRKENKFYFNEAYYNFALSLNEPILLINPVDTTIYDLDLLILPGGEDVYPLRYNQIPVSAGLPNMDFEFFDGLNLPQYIDKKTPIFGICRGLQTINVFFGGTLDQHVDEPYSSYRDQLIHLVRTKKGEVFPVNSLHHQVVDELGDGLKTTLWGFQSKKDKDVKTTIPLHIEGIRHGTLPISAVQFHPEELLNVKLAKETIEFVHNEIKTIMGK